VWHPVYRKRDGAWVWTKKPLGAPKGKSAPWPLAVNKVETQGRAYALAEAAVIAGKADGVGWLVQDELGFVWLDFDKCRDPETGAIDPWALAVMARAGDAYTEVTPSGTGIRLCGRADSLDVPMQGVWRPPGGAAEGVRPGAQVEVFYACARFMTVTGQTLGGSLEVAEVAALAFDLRQLGLAQAPARSNSKGGSATTGNVGSKVGPIEDVVSALEVIPNDGVTWDDWSRTGMAAWAATQGSWEGLEAWMGWSAKCEDKHDDAACLERWEHWRQSPPTDLGIGALVLLAQVSTGGRWRRPSRQPAAEFEKEEDEGGEAGGAEVSPFLRLAQRLIYIEELHRFLDVESKALLDDARVRTRASHMGCAGAFTNGAKGIIAQLHGHPGGLLRHVEGLTMRPGQGLLVEEGGQPCANLWRPSRLVPSDADAGLWVRHMERLIPDAVERGYVLDLLAFGLQHPGVKVNWGLVLLGGQGTGKDTALLPFFAAVGQHNVATVPGVAIGGSFNGYLRKPWLLITEMPPANKRSCYEEIKGWLTTPPAEVQINLKGIEPFSLPNVVNVVVTTNHEGAIALTEDDRRFVVVSTVAADQGEGSAYFSRLHGWLATGGLEAAAGWLLRRDVSAFNPKVVPPSTVAKTDMMREGAPPGVAWACGLWEADGGGLFEQRELLTVVEVMACAAHGGHGAGEPVRRSLNPQQVLMALRLSGWRQIRTRVSDGPTRPYPWTRSGAFELLSQLQPRDLQTRLEEDRRLRTGGGGDAWER
jgi:hypothetical protein